MNAINCFHLHENIYVFKLKENNCLLHAIKIWRGISSGLPKYFQDWNVSSFSSGNISFKDNHNGLISIVNTRPPTQYPLPIDFEDMTQEQHARMVSITVMFFERSAEPQPLYKQNKYLKIIIGGHKFSRNFKCWWPIIILKFLLKGFALLSVIVQPCGAGQYAFWCGRKRIIIFSRFVTERKLTSLFGHTKFST